MKIVFVIPGRLPGMNELFGAANRNRMVGAKIKQVNTTAVAWQIKAQKVPRFTRPIHLSIKWFERDNRRDIDNVHAGVKFILDGMQMAGILENDGRKNVWSIRHENPPPDKLNPRIEITVEEID